MKSTYPAQAVREVRWLITQSGVTASVLRPVVAGEGTFFGPHESGLTEVGTVPVEVQSLPPKDLTELGADAVASVLPDSGIRESDFLVIGEARFRVTAVKEHNFFGAITHLDLTLTLERRYG